MQKTDEKGTLKVVLWFLSTTFAPPRRSSTASPSALPCSNGRPRQISASSYLKLENLQPIGAFKLRGAYNKVASLTDEERRRGVISYSSGNHAQGVAYAARALGVRAVIVMPGNAPKNKLEATAALGAEIVTVGPGSEERRLRAEQLAAEHGYAIVPPYNDEKIIAGQGTVGLEILEDLPNVETVLIPVGGGGLISGVAAAIKLSDPNVKRDWRRARACRRCAGQPARRPHRLLPG